MLKSSRKIYKGAGFTDNQNRKDMEQFDSCFYCGKQSDDLEAGHIYDEKWEGDRNNDDETNFHPTCRSCNGLMRNCYSFEWFQYYKEKTLKS